MHHTVRQDLGLMVSIRWELDILPVVLVGTILGAGSLGGAFFAAGAEPTSLGGRQARSVLLTSSGKSATIGAACLAAGAGSAAAPADAAAAVVVPVGSSGGCITPCHYSSVKSACVGAAFFATAGVGLSGLVAMALANSSLSV